MALARRIAAFNRLATNRVLGGVAPRLPGFGVIVQMGRRSGRRYRRPVNMFRTLERELVPRAPLAGERMSA